MIAPGLMSRVLLKMASLCELAVSLSRAIRSDYSRVEEVSSEEDAGTGLEDLSRTASNGRGFGQAENSTHWS